MSDAPFSSQELRDALGDLLAGPGEPQAVLRAAEAGGVDRALWTSLAELGWLGLPIAPEHGGMGLGFEALAVLYGELGRALARVPALGGFLAAEALAGSGLPDAPALLADTASGTVAWGVALPSSLGHGAVLKINAQGRVSGRVADVLFAPSADRLMLPVRTTGGALALLVLDARAEGVRIEPRPVVDLTRELGDVVLEGVAAPTELLIPPDPALWARLHDHAAVSLAADAVAGARRILEDTVDYMKTRVQFDRLIGAFQALKHRAASWKILLEAATALTRQAAAALGDGEEGASALASEARFYACDAYAAIAGDAVQLHGGIGFTWEHQCHLFLKRAKLGQALFGSTTEHRERAASLLFAPAAARTLHPTFEEASS